MATVITQIEMMRFRGANRAVFPVGTILTPSAKDWAKEQGIEVKFEDEPVQAAPAPAYTAPAAPAAASACSDKLDVVVNAVLKAYKEAGKSFNKEDVIASVEVALKAISNYKK